MKWLTEVQVSTLTKLVDILEEGYKQNLFKNEIDNWLAANKLMLDKVVWASFPIGMVQRLIERAVKAEQGLRDIKTFQYGQLQIFDEMPPPVDVQIEFEMNIKDMGQYTKIMEENLSTALNKALEASKGTVSDLNETLKERGGPHQCICPKEVWMNQGCKCGGV